MSLGHHQTGPCVILGGRLLVCDLNRFSSSLWYQLMSWNVTTLLPLLLKSVWWISVWQGVLQIITQFFHLLWWDDSFKIIYWQSKQKGVRNELSKSFVFPKPAVQATNWTCHDDVTTDSLLCLENTLDLRHCSNGIDKSWMMLLCDDLTH